MGRLRRPPTNTAGFTLVEVMIVVGIIGILATIAIPSFNGYKKRVYLSEGYTTLSALYRAEAAYWQQSDIVGQGVNATGRNHCAISCIAGFMPPPGGGSTAHDPGAHGPGCKDLGFTHDGPERMAYWACPGPGCSKQCWDDAETDQEVYSNIVWFDFDGDSVYTFMYEKVRTKGGSLYRAARYFTGDEDDAP